jgi:hypothetical protein
MEYITDKAVIFSQVKLVSITGHYACCILPAVLQQCQTIIKQLVNRFSANYTDYAAHNYLSNSIRG